MKIKPGVKICGIKPELMLALIVCNDIYRRYGQDLVITSVIDGRHSYKSAHYSGNGADLRTRYFKSKILKKVVKAIKEALTIDFDVVVEDDHIHIEYQPKRST